APRWAVLPFRPSAGCAVFPPPGGLCCLSAPPQAVLSSRPWVGGKTAGQMMLDAAGGRFVRLSAVFGERRRRVAAAAGGELRRRVRTVERSVIGVKRTSL